MSNRLDNVREHLECAGELTKKSFDHAEVDRDNLEDFRIHVSSALTLMYESLVEIEARLDQK